MLLTFTDNCSKCYFNP